MTDFAPLPALIGGVLIGASASAMLLLSGRITGISGIAGGLWSREAGERSWRWAFVAGALVAAAIVRAVRPDAFGLAPNLSVVALASAGVLVGFGTRLSNGCTSGHGVCGIARFSPRSLIATCVFMAAGGAVVFFVRHVAGGAS